MTNTGGARWAADPPKPALSLAPGWHADQHGDHQRGSHAMSTHPPRLLAAALAAADSALYVFPVAPRGKTPAVRDWEQVATRDPGRITSWWTARPYNIGAAVGRSGIVVIDVDTARGDAPPEEFAGATSGCDVLEMLAAREGQPAPVDTYTVATPTGGAHLYFRAPEGLGLRNTAGVLGWKIDTRAEGGYVVAAGSARAEGLYRVSRSGPIARLPGWLAAALTPAPHLVPSTTPLALNRNRAGAYVQAVVESEAADVAAAPNGTRHRTRLKAARNLGRLVGGGELDEQTAYDALREAAARHIGHDCTEAEVDRDLRHGLTYGRRLPRQITRQDPDPA